jgi:hypothetical protein
VQQAAALHERDLVGREACGHRERSRVSRASERVEAGDRIVLREERDERFVRDVGVVRACAHARHRDGMENPG